MKHVRTALPLLIVVGAVALASSGIEVLSNPQAGIEVLSVNGDLVTIHAPAGSYVETLMAGAVVYTTPVDANGIATFTVIPGGAVAVRGANGELLSGYNDGLEYD